MKMRVKPPKARSIVDLSAFTDGPYMLLVFATLIGFIGLYVGIFYYSFFGQSTGITNASLAFYLVPILNAGSVFGRTLPNWLSDKIGALNVITPGKHEALRSYTSLGANYIRCFRCRHHPAFQHRRPQCRRHCRICALLRFLLRHLHRLTACTLCRFHSRQVESRYTYRNGLRYGRVRCPCRWAWGRRYPTGQQ